MTTKPMTLFWSSRSPFVRKVMIVAHEVNVADRIEAIRVAVHPANPNAQVMASHPLGKIPTLVLEDGTAVFDSQVICQYLDERFGNGRLIPSTAEKWAVRTRHAMIDALLETALVWRLEAARPEDHRQPNVMTASRLRIQSGLKALEADRSFGVSADFTLDQVAAVAALAYLDFRLGEVAWREHAPRLSEWFDSASRRPSVVATTYVDAS
ncbi:glutathione S-transferase [Chelatococcus asaccharovorans]|uniref:glutathione S-transferase n=1 Tax=Chelatococcus asaccharovorans TaxID=28210 RepID=UPI00224C66EB|nr:glutathione S-transferase [Chelatococcus asaccharovorans]CAH1649808.1 Glutathione S-transferase family protein [Chelatococcus asaccharovorans]CAH1691831.1 Glutathione S-transferase family protein [Chelatococcus asaccharovorans]